MARMTRCSRFRASVELLVEALRETPFWDRHFSIVEILPGVENAYAKNYEQQPLLASATEPHIQKPSWQPGRAFALAAHQAYPHQAATAPAAATAATPGPPAVAIGAWHIPPGSRASGHR
ncbi:hypothetical protein K5F93_18305 [Pseudomonas protegens]|uniref:darcynin family protein n=1 Tax=Pseudomonas protegens TaxID=380021 RepID=UPI001C8E36F5|nr:darcynin family protein [Pseudomonas protegens]QZI68370.1 hypothetical protein K5F93_18305 [Pseudomonas protegens]